MIDKNLMSPDERALAEMLEASAQQVDVSPAFKTELEKKLMNAHQPKTGINLFSVKSLASTLGWTVGLIVMALIFIWAIRTITPQPQPAAANTPMPSCPVTKPNDSHPLAGFSNAYGSDTIWTKLSSDGKTYVSSENQLTDGSYSMEWLWWPTGNRTLTIQGHRLDGDAPPLRAIISPDHDISGILSSTLIFPTTGCWEVNALLGEDGDAGGLNFITEVIFSAETHSGIFATPTPDVSTDTSSDVTTFDFTVKEGDTCSFIAYKYGITIKDIVELNDMPSTCPITIGQMLKIPIKTNSTIPPQGEAYDWYGTKLYLNAPLPEIPVEANIYTALPDQPATIESARALASRFGIEGQVYLAPGELRDTKNFMVTAGASRIYVRSDNYFTYYKDAGGSFIGGKNLTDDQAAAAIDAFLKSHGFNFEYQIEHAPQIYGSYYVVLKLDGLSLRHDSLLPSRMEILLDEDGVVLSVFGGLLNAQPVGAFGYGIRPAEEAFQQILNNAQAGVLQSMRSGGMLNEQIWQREYADNKTTTIYGEVRAFPSAEASQPPLITINDFTLAGNTAGLESVQEGIIVEASGQFTTDNGVRTFKVDSWKQSSTEMISTSGFLHKDGDRIFLTADDGKEYPLVDAPADAPLNTQPPGELLKVNGVMANGQLEWTIIQYFPTGGGGGGGGGNGFYKLNLTGTPVPLPTPIPQEPSSEQTPSPNAQDFEGLRGILSVTIYNQADGSQRAEYGFMPNNPAYPFMLLEGDNLQELQNNQNRPIEIWGTIDHANEYGITVAKVEKFEIPFPDLKFQILRGSEKNINIQDQIALLFTSDDGKSYVQLAPNCIDTIGPESVTGTGKIGEPILLEALIVPDLTFGGYPAICVESTSLAVDGNGQAVELTVTADQPYVTDEPPALDPNLAPSMIIEKVELVYYIKDPRYYANPAVDPAYIQPVWRFYGHYQDGSEFEFLVQALKDEFLLPELEPYGGAG